MDNLDRKIITIGQLFQVCNLGPCYWSGHNGDHCSRDVNLILCKNILLDFLWFAFHLEIFKSYVAMEEFCSI